MKFKSVEEVDHYFSGDVVECLECHKHFKHLANHVMMKHNMTITEYKQKYGIPLTYSLASKEYRDRQSKSLKLRINSGTFTYDHLPKAVDKARTAKRTRTQLNRTEDKQIYIELRNQLIVAFKSVYFDEELQIDELSKKNLKKWVNKLAILLKN